MYIKVRVKTNEKREIVERVSADTFNISVREKAENNAANKRIFEILTSFLSVDKSKIKMVTGHRSSNKIFVVG